MSELDEYLARIEYGGSTAPSSEVLDALCQAHVTHVPFENLDVLLGVPISLAPAALMDKLVRRRRGGYCFEHVILFREMLTALGFTSELLLGRVYASPALTVPPRTHALVRVQLTSGVVIADPGFGGHGPRGSLPLVSGASVQCGVEQHRLERDGDRWLLHGDMGQGERLLHAFTEERQHPIDLEVANHFTATHPASKFKNTLMLQLVLPDGRVSLHGNRLSVRRGTKLEQSDVETRRDLARILRDDFTLDVPRVSSLRVPAVPAWA